jgi:type VI secretion system protein ImpK
MAQLPEIAPPPENLALLFQELFTAIVRLRAHRQDVGDAEVFRSQVLQAIRLATQAAKARAYTDEDIQLAVFALVAFLDETILNLRQPVFREWVRKPLQEELFGRHVAGEVFFQNLQQILGRRDSPEGADVLEVYELCVLLGYLGRYSIASKGDLRSMMGHAADKIRRIRGNQGDLSPHWMLPDEVPPPRVDPWLRRLLITAAACAFLTLALFITYKITLGSDISAVQTLSLRGLR